MSTGNFSLVMRRSGVRVTVAAPIKSIVLERTFTAPGGTLIVWGNFEGNARQSARLNRGQSLRRLARAEFHRSLKAGAGRGAGREDGNQADPHREAIRRCF
jgi:hypothetical protein